MRKTDRDILRNSWRSHENPVENGRPGHAPTMRLSAGIESGGLRSWLSVKEACSRVFAGKHGAGALDEALPIARQLAGRWKRRTMTVKVLDFSARTSRLGYSRYRVGRDELAHVHVTFRRLD
jgi:hypothetical protein